MSKYSELQTLIGSEQIIGASTIIGDELTLQQAERSPQVADAIAARQGVAVVHQHPRRVRRLILPFNSATLNAAGTSGSSQTVIAQPQLLFKGKRLIIPSDIAGALVIDDIKVGAYSQYVSGSGGANGPTVPGRAFSEVAMELVLDLDTAQANTQVAMLVRNVSGGQVPFTAALFGIAVD